MTAAEFRGRAPGAIATIGQGTTREVVEAAGGEISVHTAHGMLRELEERRIVRRVGMRERAIVWSLCTPPSGR